MRREERREEDPKTRRELHFIISFHSVASIIIFYITHFYFPLSTFPLHLLQTGESPNIYFHLFCLLSLSLLSWIHHHAECELSYHTNHSNVHFNKYCAFILIPSLSVSLRSVIVHSFEHALNCTDAAANSQETAPCTRWWYSWFPLVTPVLPANPSFIVTHQIRRWQSVRVTLNWNNI